MAESASTIQESGRSGEACRRVGPYRAGSRTPLVVFFRVGDRFPNDAEGRATRWTMLSASSSGAEASGTSPVE
jgi:hypothetical protein